jgi:hypothetical protein
MVSNGWGLWEKKLKKRRSDSLSCRIMKKNNELDKMAFILNTLKFQLLEYPSPSFPKTWENVCVRMCSNREK